MKDALWFLFGDLRKVQTAKLEYGLSEEQQEALEKEETNIREAIRLFVSGE